MRTYKFRPLPYDVARCYGTNCNHKETCARYLQIALDKQQTDKHNRVVYTDSPRSGDECEIRREVEP